MIFYMYKKYKLHGIYQLEINVPVDVKLNYKV